MHFEPNAVYHIYNRSNETVFHHRDNYLFFLKKTKELIAPYCEILDWVLMPNHFHFLVVDTEDGCANTTEKHRPELQILSKNIGGLLSSYAQAINKQENRRGKLFSHNTKAKCLNDVEFEKALSRSESFNASVPDYLTTCFNYIHQNPVMAGLVIKPEEWEFSSFRDFSGLRKGTLANKYLAFQYIGLDPEDFYAQSMMLLDESMLKKVF